MGVVSKREPPTAIALIPARGGSKRIPRKNIKLFNGRPMIARAIAAAKASALFNRIIVSTDDEEIAALSKEYGAEAPFIRPDNISGDYVGTMEVVLHALSWLGEESGMPDYLCFIYPCIPFLCGSDIRKMYEEMNEAGSSSSLTVTHYAHPIWRALKIRPSGELCYEWPEHRLTRSQDLPEMLHDAGQCYWLNSKEFLIDPRFVRDDSFPFLLPRWKAQDIDNESDWVLAELICATKEGSNIGE